ncbi:MAG: S26 family signal peptidase [Ilumatobacteraceae bacterium]
MNAQKGPAASRGGGRAGWRSRLPRRFVVADRSMEPTLVDGQGLLALRSARARPGQLRCFEHPERPAFWLVKRVDQVLDDGTMVVLSDNRTSTLADSRSFGPVPVDGSYRVVVRIPRRLM